MTEAALLDSECFQTTDGEIAIVNLNSARLRSGAGFIRIRNTPASLKSFLNMNN